MKKLLIAGIILTVFLPLAALANNITVSNVSLIYPNATAKTAVVKFNISWNDAWRNTVNNDAAWVFVKYSTDGGVTWSHATLASPLSYGGTALSDGGTGGIKCPAATCTVTGGYSGGTVTVASVSTTPLDIIVPTELNSGYKGAFLQLASTLTSSLSGNLNATGVQLVWNWGADGLSSSTSAQVQVFAVEMVYVPTGAFYLGDGTTSTVTGQFEEGISSATPAPFQVTTEGLFTLGGGSGASLGNSNASGMYTADDFNDTTSQTLPSNSSFNGYPRGYNAFYMMKYDVSQQHWVDFLNTLTRTQQNYLIKQGGGPDLSTATSLAQVPSNDVYVMSNSTMQAFRNAVEVTAIPSATTAPMTFGIATSTFSIGSTTTISGSNTIQTFTSSGTITFPFSASLTVLIVAGGGSGGGCYGSYCIYSGGGGGAGGVLYGTTSVSEGQYTVTVGAGGAAVGAVTTGNNGGNSSFGSFTANGGGGGATGSCSNGLAGGSGGGPTCTAGSALGGAATQGNSGSLTGYGNSSGASNTSTIYGGGGGAGGAGGPGVAGVGIVESISGSSVTYAAGGASSGTSGSPNTGNGGGGGVGGSNGAVSGAGGSGIVILSYPSNTFTSSVNGSNSGKWLAMNYLSWMDGAAYAAWAGLRPFTELEYEKAARGPSIAAGGVDNGVANEYAWGTTSITQATSIVNSSTNAETAGQTGNGLCAYGNSAGVPGPMRVGFAATGQTNRVGAGASYWGIMDLSGNVWQRVVTVGNSTGRAFTGTNGTGVLDPATGDATNSDWPGFASGVVSGATGAGIRGGTWYFASTLARVSDRYYAALVAAYRNNDYGARFARTAP